MDIQRIKTMFKNNKSQYDSIFAFYRSMGLDISNRGSICPKSRIEMPTRIYEATIVRGRIRAFTYIGSDTFIHDTTIKRYCSIAKSVNIGHGNHPIHWLSTNPFMYDQGFRIRTGNLFPNHKDYVSYQVPQNNRIQLKKDVSLPPFTSIGNDVWIGTGAIILPNLTIGDGAIIGAGSVVTKDIPPYAIAVGNPARVIKYRFTEKQIEELLKIQWWDYSPWDLHATNIEFFDIDKSIAQLKHSIEKNILTKYKDDEVEISTLNSIYEEIRR